VKLNCKVGDLAVIVKDRYMPENIGKLVVVLEPGDQEWEDADGFYWYVQAIGSPIRCRLYEDAEFTGELSFDMEANVADHELKPIRDHEGDDETLTWKTEEETV
jgi:hypothetical protein